MTQKAPQQLKYKVKQFQWFEMETRVRQIIQEVLGALQKRVLESSGMINKLKFTQGQSQKKIQQITLMIENDPKVFQTGIFGTVERRFQQQQKKIQQLSRQIDEENKYVDQKFKILDIRMQQSSEVLQNVASLRQRVSKQIQIQNSNINTVRENIEKMINDLNTDIRQTRKQQQENLQFCEKEDYALRQRIDKNSDDIKQMKETIDNHEKQHTEKSIKIQKILENLRVHSDQINGLQQSKSLTKKLEYIVKDFQNQLRKVEFKLEGVSPLITQAQISQCLYYVLPPKMRNRVAIHQYKKYYKLNRQVLEKQYESTNVFHGLELLKQMQQKNTTQIVKLKRKKLQAQGIKIDDMSYEQRQRYYNDVVLEEAAMDDDQQIKVTTKIDQKQITKIMEKHFNKFALQTGQKVMIQLQDSKKYLYGIEDQIKLQVSTFENKIKSLKDGITIVQAEQLLQNKVFHEQIKNIHKLFERNDAEHLKISETQKSFYNFCSLVNHLQIQDEIDKQNISLMGVSQNNSEDLMTTQIKSSIVELDKKCFSCCGFPASTLSAFKMACLAYNPSSISIDSRQYRREQLLGITTSLLQKIKKNFTEMIKTLQPNNTNEANISSLNQSQQKIELTNEELKNKIIADNQNSQLNKRANNSGVKFRKTKKFVGNSATKYYNKSIGRQSTGLKQDLMTATQLFNELKRRNTSFLN